jgi:hypothetical protein
VQRKNQLQASYYAQEQAAHGILMRLEALSELSSGNSTVADARILLFLLFLVIECLPVTVKLLQRPGQYEAAMREAKKAEERDFKKAFATRSRLGFAGLASGQRPAVLQLQPEPTADPIWTRTRPLPMSATDHEDARPTEVFRNPRPGGGAAGNGSPAGPPRRQRRWRGADEYRNFWNERDADSDPRTGRARPAADPFQAQTRLDAPAGQTRQDPWAAETMLDSQPAPTRLDYPQSPAPGGDSWASYHDEDEPASGGAAQPDGNGSGVPLNWDDE